METQTDTRTDLPFTLHLKDDASGVTEVQTWHDDQRLHNWPTKSTLLKGDSSVGTPVDLTDQNAKKLLADLPGHPRNTILEWLDGGGIVEVKWADRSLRVNAYLPAVEARPDGTNAPGALFHTMEELVNGTLERNRYSGPAIGWTVYWGWNWENSALAYDAESPRRIRLNLDETGRFYTQDSRVSYENVTLKNFRKENELLAPKAYEQDRQIRLAEAHDLAQKVDSYDPEAPVPSTIRRVAEERAQALLDQLNHEYERLAREAVAQTERIAKGELRQAQRRADSSSLVVDQDNAEGILMAVNTLRELNANDGEVRNDKLVTIVDNYADMKEVYDQWTRRFVAQDPSQDDRGFGATRTERAMWKHLLHSMEVIDRAVQRVA